MQFRKLVPSLTALVALEATIRHRSVTRAARELGVTQAAVSRQIAVLEAEFGPLFVRGHRSIEPTGPCAALGATLGRGFATIAEGIETLRAVPARPTVTIGATLAFSTFWLLPRLAAFRQLHPGIQIRVVSQDERLGLEGGEIDIAVRFGSGPFPDGAVLFSRPDAIVTVCAPRYAERHADLPVWDKAHELIETDVGDRSWYTWPDWFRETGHAAGAREPALRFSHYADTVEAARAGQGVALGWRLLVAPFLADGSLVELRGEPVVPDGRYNVLVPHRARGGAVRDVAADWIIAALTP